MGLSRYARAVASAWSVVYNPVQIFDSRTYNAHEQVVCTIPSTRSMTSYTLRPGYIQTARTSGALYQGATVLLDNLLGLDSRLAQIEAYLTATSSFTDRAGYEESALTKLPVTVTPTSDDPWTTHKQTHWNIAPNTTGWFPNGVDWTQYN